MNCVKSVAILGTLRHGQQPVIVYDYKIISLRRHLDSKKKNATEDQNHFFFLEAGIA